MTRQIVSFRLVEGANHITTQDAHLRIRLVPARRCAFLVLATHACTRVSRHFKAFLMGRHPLATLLLATLGHTSAIRAGTRRQHQQ